MAEVATRNAPIEYYSSGLRERFRLDALKLNPPKISKDQAFADIEYGIDENKYHARSQARIRAGGLEPKVPHGWPTALEGPMVWSTVDFQDEGKYVLHLDDADKKELDGALKYFKGSQSDL